MPLFFSFPPNRPPGALLTSAQTAILALLLSLFAATPVFFVLMVLLGAPLTTHHAETLLCAAHIALLFAPPLFYTRGVEPRAWREVAALMLPGDAVWGGSLGVIVGSWLGAVPIPLDWDRDWQRWPVTIVAGAYAGWAAGRVLGEFVLLGKRVPMDAE